jgi:hypothetical protein
MCFVMFVLLHLVIFLWQQTLVKWFGVVFNWILNWYIIWHFVDNAYSWTDSCYTTCNLYVAESIIYFFSLGICLKRRFEKIKNKYYIFETKIVLIKVIQQNVLKWNWNSEKVNEESDTLKTIQFCRRLKMNCSHHIKFKPCLHCVFVCVWGFVCITAQIISP